MERVLITGSSGFIGSAIKSKLLNLGYEVWELNRNRTKGKYLIKGDLLNIKSFNNTIEKIEKFSFLIHCAAKAHSKFFDSKTDLYNKNILITKNVLTLFQKKVNHFIFTSSVAVYGEDSRNSLINTDSSLRPSTLYGQSKLECENLLKNSGIKNYTILRLTPVFDSDHMFDIKKRVYLPLLKSIKFKIKPAPKYSFANIETVADEIVKVIVDNKLGKNIKNISDKNLYYQNILANKFEGNSINISINFFKILYFLSFIMPNKRGYKIRCALWKVFKNNIY